MRNSDNKNILWTLLLTFVLLVTAFILINKCVPTPAQREGKTGAGKQYVYSEQRAKVEQREIKKQLQDFDPNTADSTLLISLGFNQNMIKSVYSYRSKGGVYMEPEQIAYIYGMSMMQYEELLPYVKIAPQYRPARDMVQRKTRGNNWSENIRNSEDECACIGSQTNTRERKTWVSNKLKSGQTIDLNLADTTELQRVPGVGLYFAKRIAEERERLGGYVRVEQLMSIRNLPDTIYHYFTLSAGSVKKINLNTADMDVMSRHPLIGYRRATIIRKYREKIGPLSSLDQLSAFDGFNVKADLEILSYYVDF